MNSFTKQVERVTIILEAEIEETSIIECNQKIEFGKCPLSLKLSFLFVLHLSDQLARLEAILDKEIFELHN